MTPELDKLYDKRSELEARLVAYYEKTDKVKRKIQELDKEIELAQKAAKRNKY